MNPVIALAPLWFAFELCQLVLAERYLGIRQIARGIDPRTLPLGNRIAAFWSIGIGLYWLWMLLALVQPTGQLQVIALGIVSMIGFAVRKNCPMKWVLVTLTFEAAIRIGMLLSLFIVALRHS